MDVLQRVQLRVPANRREWTDSGIVLGEGESLHLSATGPVTYRNGPGYAWPEGVYSDDANASHANQPTQTINGYTGRPINQFAASNIKAFSLALAVRTGSDAPSNGIGGPPIADAFQGARDVTFDAIGPGRVWLVFNDINTNDNGREFGITLERLGAADPLYPGTVSPIRLVPPDVAREKMRSVEETAICWFIRPKWGAVEGYTELDFPVSCPQIDFPTGRDEAGATLTTSLPALDYQPFSGLKITGIPTSVKLGVDAPDVTVINFDRTKLRREYYEEAQVEIFEVALSGDRSQAVSYLSGVIGNCEGDDLQATIELTPWDELTNLPTGWKLGFLCDVGRLPGEEFGTMRCRNMKKFDGVNIADWTRGAELASIVSLSRLVISPRTLSGYAGYEPSFPGSHGIIRFVGGELDGLRRDVGRFNAANGTLDLRRALPLVPALGELMEFRAGCDHTLDGAQGCMFWQQGRNFRNTPFLPGRDAMKNQIKL